MKALIAMSGGVDSSVAALLMQRQGYTCIGCTMRLYENEDAGIPRENTCCSLFDVEYARSIANALGMDYYVFNFTEDFEKKVIQKFVNRYENGLTPNPCIDCNRYMKFEKLFDRARILGCEKVVTGHYAKVIEEGGRYFLKKGADETKDQSYVLYSLTQRQLSHVRFPLGDLKKSETRRIAAENGFSNAEKPDSQDICFVPDGDYASVLALHTEKSSVPGNFVNRAGEILGQHRGIVHYTVGQRKGLGISAGKPLYVIRIDPIKNQVTLGTEGELYTGQANVTDFNWISGEVPKAPVRCTVRVRYRGKEIPATAIPTGEDSAKIIFDIPRKSVTPGQAAVLYSRDTVLGGGTISQGI